MKHPDAGVIRNHIDGFHLCLHEGNDIGSVVLEKNMDCVTDLSLQDRAKNSRVFPLRSAGLEPAEGVVCIFAVQGFAINGSNSVRSPFGEYRRVALELHAHHLVDTARGIAPVHLVRGKVIRANFRSLRLPETSRNGQQGYDD